MTGNFINPYEEECKFKKHCHNLYKLNWLLQNRISIRELFENLDAIYRKNLGKNPENNYPSDNLTEFEETSNFGPGQMYKDYKTFCQELYVDKKFMKEMLNEQENKLYDKFIEKKEFTAKIMNILKRNGIEKNYNIAKEELKDKYELSDEANNGWTNEMIYCYEEFIGAESLEIYGRIAEECKKHDIKKVWDIGCCYPWQAYIFKAYGIEYYGIEGCPYMLNKAPKDDMFHYMAGKYPFKSFLHITDKEHTAAISNLCVGFTTEPAEKTWEDIARDFKYFCGIPGGRGQKTMEEKFDVKRTDFYNILWLTSKETRT